VLLWERGDESPVLFVAEDTLGCFFIFAIMAFKYDNFTCS
jgi:hypothetical protein